MQNLFEEVKDILQRDERLTANGKLLKNKVAEMALQLDARLLKLLLSNKNVKKHFFQQVENVVVFDKVKFQQFIGNKAFLPDSFTSFKNKIGLTNHHDFIAQNKQIVLAWPYKDAVLEGGQTKEDAKRKEVFLNTALAPNEIDRLLHPKVLTNFKKFYGQGPTIPTTLSVRDNFIIKGNNLLVMHSLKPRYAGKIKLIYIDPPYNTGSDGFLYNDSFNHTTWLTFMKNRLEVAWDLLSTDGSIFIQVDDTEFAYLKVMCDELFGRENFKENIIIKSSTESGVNAINVKRGERLFKVKENILFYSKSPSFRFKPFYTKAAYNTNYKYEVVKGKNGYVVRDISKIAATSKPVKKHSAIGSQANEPEFVTYALAHPENIYSLEKNIKKAGEKFKAFAATNKPKGIVEAFVNAHHQTVLMYDGGVLVPLNERIVTENGKNYFGVLASDLWVDIGTTPSHEGGIAFNNGKKPEKLLKRIIEMATNEGDIVLDYHLGSGTTAAVAHKLNRRYIGIEQMDYGENDSVVRLQNVINGEQSGISKTAEWNGGGSFVYFELLKLNQVFMDKITAVKNDKQANALFIEIMNSRFICYHVDKTTLEKHASDFKNLSLEDKQKSLQALLDLNLLYVPYTEIGDKDYAVSKENIALNHQFYSLKH